MSKMKKSYIIFILIYISIFYLLIIFFDKNYSYIINISNTLQTIPSIITLFILLRTCKKPNSLRKHFWIMLSIGCANYLISQLIWDYNEIFLRSNSPASAYVNILWVISGLCYIFATLLITYQKKNSCWLFTLILDILTIMCLFTAITIFYIFNPLLKITGIPGIYGVLMNLQSILYPIGDLICLSVIFSLSLSLTSNDNERRYLSFISLSFFIMSITNLSYSYLYITKSYSTGNLIDPLWALSIFILGLSGVEYMDLVQSKKSSIKIKNDTNINSVSVYPILCVILLFIFFITKQDESIRVCFELSIILIMIRHIFVILQNRKLILKLQNLNEALESKVTTRTKALARMAFHDQLTGLANRRSLENTVKKTIQLSKENNRSFALLFLDLDRFKAINDTFGHCSGDILLKEVAKRLKECLDSNSFLSRQGGDEFAIIVNNIKDTEKLKEICEEILNSLSKPITFNNHSVYITCSIGITIYPTHGHTLETLMKHADSAMYRSKSSDKNTYQFYNCAMDKLISKKLIIEQELRNAITNNEFTLYYQPQYDILTNKIIGAEALIRWVHPAHGLIPPSDFIPIAEETGLIDDVGKWVMNSACSQVKKWQDHGFKSFKIGVNVSPHQFKQEDFVSEVYKILHKTGLPYKYLDLEITETVGIEDTLDAIAKLNSLRKSGIKISIDDFGTGYSSLSYLTKFPIDTLKIDKSFIQNMNNDPNSKTIVSSIIAVGKNLNLDVIAEGVETKEQLEFLKSQDCIQIQGYLFSKPVPADEFEKLLNNAKSHNTWCSAQLTIYKF